MNSTYWSDWYIAWGWLLWFGMIFLLITGIGNWGYSYNLAQKTKYIPGKDPLDILLDRYVRGEIEESEYFNMKKEVVSR